MREYIDVRGPWPIWFNGATCIRLVGAKRDITIHEAMVGVMRLEIGPDRVEEVA